MARAKKKAAVAKPLPASKPRPAPAPAPRTGPSLVNASAVRFVRTYQVKSAGGELYQAGDVLSCSAETADHFIRRGAAVLHGGAEDDNDPPSHGTDT